MEEIGEYEKSSKEIAKEKKISKEFNRLKKLCAELPDNKKAAIMGMLQEVSFMKITLEECKEEINRKGVIVLFEQGAQKLMIENPASKIYNTMINRYTTACKQIIDAIPDGTKAKEEEDKLIAFVGKAKK